MTARLGGQCLCRAVTFEVADDFAHAMDRHCSNCRRATGSPFKPLGGIALGHLRVVEGANCVFRFGEGADHDVHCATCGSLLCSVVRGRAFAHVALGTLLDAPSLRPSARIFAGSKAPWSEVADGLPRHRALP